MKLIHLSNINLRQPLNELVEGAISEFAKYPSLI